MFPQVHNLAAGSFATHQGQAKLVSRNIGAFTLLQHQIPNALASRICQTPWSNCLGIRDGYPIFMASPPMKISASAPSSPVPVTSAPTHVARQLDSNGSSQFLQTRMVLTLYKIVWSLNPGSWYSLRASSSFLSKKRNDVSSIKAVEGVFQNRKINHISHGMDAAFLSRTLHDTYRNQWFLLITSGLQREYCSCKVQNELSLHPTPYLPNTHDNEQHVIHWFHPHQMSRPSILHHQQWCKYPHPHYSLKDLVATEDGSLPHQCSSLHVLNLGR